MKKVCPDCGTRKDIEEFHKHKLTKDKRNTYCKACTIKRTKKYREHHLEEIKEAHKIYREVNAKAIQIKRKVAGKKHYAIKENRDIKSRESKEHYRIHHKRINARHLEYRKRNKVRINADQKKKNKIERDELHPHYVKYVLFLSHNLRAYQVPPELLELKGEYMLLHRELQTFKKEVQNGNA